MDTMQVTVKRSFGNVRVYPDCAISRAFAELTGTKTFTKAHLKTIEAIGYKAVISNQTPYMALGLEGLQ